MGKLTIYLSCLLNYSLIRIWFSRAKIPSSKLSFYAQIKGSVMTDRFCKNTRKTAFSRSVSRVGTLSTPNQ